MAIAINNLFNFGRNLPEPFDKLASKKVSVSSKYGDGTTSTLCATVIKAIHAVCHCMNGSGEGAVGVIDHRTIAEYKSSNNVNEFHIVVHDSTTGALQAGVYDRNTETMATYVMNNAARDGSAVMMALFPTLMQDDEFNEQYGIYYNQFISGFPDMAVATNSMAMLCDNA